MMGGEWRKINDVVICSCTKLSTIFFLNTQNFMRMSSIFSFISTILDTAIHHKDRDIQHKDTTVGTYTLLKRVCMNVVFYCLWFDKALLPETMKWTLQMQCKKA